MSGGIIVTIFDTYPRGVEWNTFRDMPVAKATNS